MNKLPLVTIVVAVYNSEKTIEKTLKSILNQDYTNIEIVIIDGGSSDKTINIIEKYKDKIDFFVSEKDNGIANAYNKGIKNSKGKWVYFLNADDVFCSANTVTSVVDNFSDDVDIVSGRVIKDDGDIINGQLGWTLLLRNGVHHQSNFYKRSILEQYKYNEDYARYGHDHEHNIIIWKKNIPVKYISVDVALWASGGVSDSAKWVDYKQEF